MVEQDSASLDRYYLDIKTYLFDQTKDNRNKNFEDLKQKFSTQVNSNRRMDYINDVRSLVQVLEKRGEIHKFKTKLFEQIFDFYNIDKTIIHEHMQFLQSISNNQASLFRRKVNVYALQLQKEFLLNAQLRKAGYESPVITGGLRTVNVCHKCQNTESYQGNHHTTYIDIENRDNEAFGVMEQSEGKSLKHSSNCEEKIIKNGYRVPERVIEIVTSVGRKWTDLARQLSLIELTINKITDDVSLDLDGKIRKVLAEYETNCINDCNEDEIIPGLLRALEKIKRNDLRLKVDGFLRRYNNRNSSS